MKTPSVVKEKNESNGQSEIKCENLCGKTTN
jgi:hypothetical protein